MPGTKAGAKQAMATIYTKFGDKFHAEIGALGGAVKNPDKGFGGNRQLARWAGAIGGSISRRGGAGTPDHPDPDVTCNFCQKQGHRALYCPVRANVKKRRQVVLARNQVLREQAELNRQALSSLAQRRGSKRPW